MENYDVFNGDADGICALLQLRAAAPSENTLITGVKRDIALLSRIADGPAASVTVLDVSLDKNREPLNKLLAGGASVFYCDHHFAGEIPEHPSLDALINTSADVCTSLLVNGRLGGAFAHWAVVGAFGDNLEKSANAVARTLDLDTDTLSLYKRLGTYINYNGYGATLEDLHFHPAELYQLMCGYPDPSGFVAEAASTFARLEDGYHGDMGSAETLTADWEESHAAVFRLPNAPWARRVSGVYGNSLANNAPNRAHAVLTEKAAGGFLVSVRAPLNDKRDADTLCRQFPTGGGRAAAAGINELAEADLQAFIDAFSSTYR
ncbi:MAG: DHH family phosphoesterase [Congregibacter sp.]